MKRASLIAAALMLASATPIPKVQAGPKASTSTKWVRDYHAVVPLGEDVLLLPSVNRTILLLASAQSVSFEDWREIVEESNRSLIRRSDGMRVRSYPRWVDFRVTVSARGRTQMTPLRVELDKKPISDINEFLLGLRFRVKVFHALRATVIEPSLVRLVGVPEDVPYDERVYRASFDLGEVPLEDRIVLEVLSPGGERLTRFHLDM